MNREQKRALRREIRREAFDHLRDCGGRCNKDEMKAHLEDEFGGLANAQGFDPASILAIIQAIIRILELFGFLT